MFNKSFAFIEILCLETVSLKKEVIKNKTTVGIRFLFAIQEILFEWYWLFTVYINQYVTYINKIKCRYNIL